MLQYERVDPASQDWLGEDRLKTQVADIIGDNVMENAEILQDDTNFDSSYTVFLAGYSPTEDGIPYLIQLKLVKGMDPNDDRVIIEYGEERFELQPEKTKSFRTGTTMSTKELELTGDWLHGTKWSREASLQLAIVSGKNYSGQIPKPGWLRSYWDGFTNK
jgi:hypothetical protein